MPVKMLTTKKHTKTAKVISKIKETNKPIEVVKVKKEVKKVAKQPIAKIPKIGKREYNRALKIVNQYLKENEKN